MSKSRISRRRFIQSTAAGTVVSLLTSCDGSSNRDNPMNRPNILWIVAEDISPLFGCYEYEDAATPHVDAFAARSHVFSHAYATAPICAPSRSCLATGMYATSLGTQNLRSEVRIPDRIQPLAKLFKKGGYWTSLRGKTDYNFDPDGLFDYWDQDKAPWQKCPDDKPFFSFMNLGSTHEGSGNRADRAAGALERLAPELKHDPAATTPPPYFPDTPELRRLWARYMDLLTVWDHDVNEVLKRLEKDGRAENTVVFLMADHGMGMPRYKRWLYLTGLQVPLIVHIPEKFKHLAGANTVNGTRDELVSYVDLPPTVLQFAGIPVPDNFQGKPLFKGKKREFVFGARDRADDMYDLSRCVFDGRYLYIRHYMPHMIPMQEGIIMSPYTKEFHKELVRIHEAGQDSEQSAKLWNPRPFEELYDIQNDPRELKNVADDPSLKTIKADLAARLSAWILETRDSGFMTEADMHRRANEVGKTPFDILQDDSSYPVRAIFEAAGQASKPESSLLPAGNDAMVTFWAIQQRIMRQENSKETVIFLEKQLKHKNPSVRTAAAEALVRIGHEEPAIPVFRDLLKAEEANLLLFVARSLAISFNDVRPLEKEVREARQRMLAPPGSSRPWKDFNYSAFTAWALEWALIKSGLNMPEDFDLL